MVRLNRVCLVLAGSVFSYALVASSAALAQSLNDAYTQSLERANGGDLEGAAEYAAQALAIADQKLGPNHEQTGILAFNLGHLYAQLNLYAEAQPVLERSVAIYGAKHGQDSPELLSPLGSLAEVYQALGLHKETYDTHERIVEITEQLQGRNSVEVAMALGPLAQAADRMGRAKRVRSHLVRAQRIWRKERGKDSIEVAEVTFFLALNYLREGNLRSGAENIDRALEIFEEKLPEGDPQKIQIYTMLVQMNEQFGRAREAREYREKLETNERIARETAAATR